MKKRSGWIAVAIFGVALLAGLVGVLLFGMGRGEGESLVVSTGVQQLASEAPLFASARVGESVRFSPEWFDRALGGARVSAITVTCLPDVTAK